VDAIRFATGSWDGLLEMFAAPGQNGPLYFLALRPWLHLAGLSGFALRFFSVFFGTLVVPLSYRLCRRLFPKHSSLSLLAAILAATSPYLVWYSQEGKMYSLVVLLVLLSMDRYVAALNLGGWQRWLLYIAFTGAAVYVHFLAALLIPAQILAFLFVGADKRQSHWKPWLASLGVLVLPYLPLLRWQLPLVLSPAETGYGFVPLHKMLLSLVANYSLGIASGQWVWAASLSVILLPMAAWQWRRQRVHLASSGILLSWLWVPVLGLFLLTLVRPMYTARYLIFVLPAYLVLVAAGAIAVAERSRVLAGLLVGAILCFNFLGLFRQSQTPLKADFRSATAYVASAKAPNDLLIFQIPYGRHSFDYYLARYQERVQQDKQQSADPEGRDGEYQVFMPLVVGGTATSYRWADGLYTNHGIDQGAAFAAMERITAGSEIVWLIATEVGMWDARGLVQDWLGQNASLMDEAHFVGVSVYRYKLRVGT
jgi:4-amino-4-deoxy-L-arabinose transferase-like glycosyltransferase